MSTRAELLDLLRSAPVPSTYLGTVRMDTGRGIYETAEMPRDPAYAIFYERIQNFLRPKVPKNRSLSPKRK